MEDFSLNEEGELFIRWNINSSYTKLSFNELITELIQEYKHTGGVYEAFVQNDGKLIGNEKIVIIRNMRDIIQIAVVLKKFLESKYIKKQNNSQLLEVKFLDEYSFQLIHKFKMEEIAKIKSVRYWYDNYLKLQVLQFIEDLKNALADKVITEEEGVGLANILDQMILGSAILYEKLSYENLMN